MRYYKRVHEGYILCVGTDIGGIEITKEEYDEIMEAIKNKPEYEEGCDWRLKDNLTWEKIQVTIQEQKEEQEE